MTIQKCLTPSLHSFLLCSRGRRDPALCYCHELVSSYTCERAAVTQSCQAVSRASL